MQLNESDEVDQQVLTAGQAAIDSGRITPLLKVELWAKIQSRRLSEGKEEMKVHFDHPKNAPMTRDEVIRQKARRESNRIAARKCRRKKKECKSKAEEVLSELHQRNIELKTKIAYLEEEKDAFVKRLVAMNKLNPEPEEREDDHTASQPCSEEEEEMIDVDDFWYCNSSQEVPTSSFPPVESTTPIPTTPQKIVSPVEVADSLDDGWLEKSFDYNEFIF